MRFRLAVALVASTTPLQRIALALYAVESPVDPSDTNHVVGLAPRSAPEPTRSQHAPMPSRGICPRPGSDAERRSGVLVGQPSLRVPYPPTGARTP
jgi:hypothetical protein